MNNMKPTTQELAMLAAAIAPLHRDKTAIEIASEALELWQACDLIRRDNDAKPDLKDRIQSDAPAAVFNAPPVPLKSLLVELMPQAKDGTERMAHYRHFLKSKGTRDAHELIGMQTKDGVACYLAGHIRADFQAWRAKQISNERSKAGMAGAAKRDAKLNKRRRKKRLRGS